MIESPSILIFIGPEKEKNLCQRRQRFFMKNKKTFTNIGKGLANNGVVANKAGRYEISVMTTLL